VPMLPCISGESEAGVEIKIKPSLHTGRNFEKSPFISRVRARFAEVLFSLDWAPQPAVIAHPMSAPGQGHESDHFQPHYRMRFALMSG
jgi:hypothetical protein